MDFLKDFAVPLILLVVGIVGKLIIHGKNDLDSWFMGPDLILVGIGSDLGHLLRFSEIFFSDNSASNNVLRGAGKDLSITAGYALVAAVFYLAVLRIHQAYDSKQSVSRRDRIFWLGVVSNIFGAITFAALFFLLRRMSGE